MIYTCFIVINLLVPLALGENPVCNEDLGYTDPDLGTVSLEPERYCDPRNLRSPGGPTCCAPSPPSEIFPIFTLFPAGKSYNYTVDWRHELPKHIYSQIAKTTVYYVVHGYAEPMPTRINQWLIPAAKVLNSTGNSVIIVDWAVGADVVYGQAIANLRTVGKTIGFSLFKWKVYKRAKLVGHSLGAQVLHEASLFARKLKNVKPKYCLGLDPAGPAFEGTKTSTIRLNRNSCELVNIIHSSSSTYPTNLNSFVQESGNFYKSGHCDWWINCGHIQPDCMDFTQNQIATAVGFAPVPEGDLMNPINNLFVCSHHAAIGVWLTSLRRCNFRGLLCLDCGRNGKTFICESDSRTNASFLQCNNKQNVNYYVKTTPFPYC